jgi:hypothetical protein
MAAETEGYKLPSKRPPHLDDGPQTERQRLARRAEREEREATEQAERQKRERPIREAEAKLKETHKQLAAVMRDRLTNPKIHDPDLFVSRDVVGANMPEADAVNFNIYHLKLFMEEHEDFLPSDRNLGLLGDYFQRHGVGIATFEMLEKLYQRMVDTGIEFDQRESVPEPQQTTSEQTFVNLTIEPSPNPRTYKGRDYATGLDREFTEREVQRMGSLEYRRAFPIAETIAELLTSMSNERDHND